MITPTETEVLESAVLRRLTDVRVCLPGKVTAYNSTTRRCSVQPLIRDAHLTEDATRKIERLPVIVNVPVMMPGSGGVRIKFPVSAGDEVLILFSQVSWDRFLALGGEVDPQDDRMFHLSDAVVIPGDLHAPEDASPQIEFTSALLLLGSGSATEAVLKGTTFSTALTTFILAFNTFVGLMVDAAGPTSVQRGTMTTAATAFKLATSAALSATVKTV